MSETPDVASGSPLRKAIRTLQSEFPMLKSAKDGFYRHSRRLLRRPHERDFEALCLIPDMEPGCFVDIGANHGQSIESIRLFKPRAQIVSFEANPYLAERLKRRYAGQGNVTVHDVGLGDHADSFTLFVPSYKGFVYDGLASFDRHAAQSWLNPATIYGFDARRLRIEEIGCRVEILDARYLNPIFMKIDVQGFEYQVLCGAQATLRRSEPILLIENVHANQRLEALLGELGYYEYHYRDQTLVRGRSPGENSFMITERRRASLATGERQ